MRGDHLVNLEGRNVVLESIKVKRNIKKIYIENSARGKKIETIIKRAKSLNIPVDYSDRKRLNNISNTENHQGVIALAESIRTTTSSSFLKQVEGTNIGVVILHDITYEQNLGAVIRTCSASGIHAIVVPKGRKTKITPVVERMSMGGINEVVVIEESFYSALKNFKRSGFKVIAIETTGENEYFKEDLTGNNLFIFGSESETLDEKILNEADVSLNIPMKSSISSLNISVSVGIVMYERVRQMAD